MINSRKKKLPTIQKVLGDIGEHFVQQYLLAHTQSYVRADSIDYLALHLLREDVNESFDYSIENIRCLTERCRNSLKCVRFNTNKRPCLKEEFYRKNYTAAPYLDWHDTGDNKFRYYCAQKLSSLEIMSYSEDFNPRNQFLLDYLISSSFIQNYYRNESDLAKNYEDMSDLEKKEWHRYWKGHPGRLDFFAKDKDNYYCIDSKVNSSKLSLWQHIRMSWMMKCGHNSQIYNVKIKSPNKEMLTELYVREGIDSAMIFANPELNIINYEPSMSKDADRITSDMENFINIAQMTFPEDDIHDLLYID